MGRSVQWVSFVWLYVRAFVFYSAFLVWPIRADCSPGQDPTSDIQLKAREARKFCRNANCHCATHACGVAPALEMI